MLLAEALQERADNNRLIEQLKSRINANVIMQEGVDPAEDANELIKALESVISRQETLIAAINLTNSTTIADGKTLTELIAKRDMLEVRISAYKAAADNASNLCSRYSRTEIAQLSAIDVKAVRKTIDRLSAELRNVDNLIQKTNWTAELVQSPVPTEK